MKIFKNAITEKLYAISDADYEEAVRDGAKEASFLNTEDTMRYTIPFADMEMLDNFDTETLDIRVRVMMGEPNVDRNEFLAKVKADIKDKAHKSKEQFER